jgi:uracil-DNA glycosylase
VRESLLASIAEEVVTCHKCDLGSTRTKAVPGVGPVTARICFVGEGPGREEDATGIPFVGQCRPPNNRPPEASEVAACSLYLYAQLAVVQPSVICLLGNTALRFFFGDQYSIGQVRGTMLMKDGQRFMPTYHPAAALRNPDYVRVIQNDLRKLVEFVRQAER